MDVAVNELVLFVFFASFCYPFPKLVRLPPGCLNQEAGVSNLVCFLYYTIAAYLSKLGSSFECRFVRIIYFNDGEKYPVNPFAFHRELLPEFGPECII